MTAESSKNFSDRGRSRLEFTERNGSTTSSDDQSVGCCRVCRLGATGAEGETSRWNHQRQTESSTDSSGEIGAEQAGYDDMAGHAVGDTGDTAPGSEKDAGTAVDEQDYDSKRDHDDRAQTDHSGHEGMFRRRFWVSLVLSIPVLVYSPFIQGVLGYTAPAFPVSGFVSPVLAVVVFAYGGVPFLWMARTELTNREPGMMMLISLAITVAFGYSIASLVLPSSTTFFWELVTLIDVMLLGHWIEMRSVRQASGALDELAELMPDTAERVTDDGTEEVSVADLDRGDVVLVRPGASIPADGEVVEGDSSVDESMVTGESKPVEKEPDDEVIGGSINNDGSLRVEVTATGDDTALAGIMRLVDEAQQSKSQTQLLADRAAGWLFYIALAAAAITAVAWTIATSFGSPSSNGSSPFS